MGRPALFLAILLWCRCLFAAAPVPDPPPAPLIAAKAAVLMDCRTGLVLWSYRPDQQLPMASTTKIMTAIVILDLGREKMNQLVTVSEHAGTTGGSSVFGAGDIVTLGDLFKAILLRSSNEAAVAAAEFLAGSEGAFVDKMNAKAAQILGEGHCHTHFVNPHGLYDNTRGAQHYSSARDLALITRYALLYYPEIRQTVAQGAYGHPLFVKARTGRIVQLENHNRILGKAVPGAPGAQVDGVKTGFVVESGKCLVSSATQNGWKLIGVVLGSDNRYFQESLNLLSYGFTRYEWQEYPSTEYPSVSVQVAWGTRGDIPVGTTGVLGAPMPRPEYGSMAEDRVVFRGKHVSAPVRRGQEIGELVLERSGHPIAVAPAIALQAVQVAWWAHVLRILCYLILTALLLFGLGKLHGTIAKNRRRRRRRIAAGGRSADHGGTHHG